MNNENSIESLYSEALGISDSNRPVFSQSNEGFDGFDDALEVEIARGFENLNFIDTYSAMQQKNSAEMIRMCKKLSVNYGLKSGVNEKAAKSIESLCNVYSTEDENKDGEKKEGFFIKVIETVKKIFRKIGEFITKFVYGIKRIINSIKKPDRDLTEQEKNLLVSDDQFWKPHPKYLIIKGYINVEEFKHRIQEFKAIAEECKKYSLKGQNSEIDTGKLLARLGKLNPTGLGISSYDRLKKSKYFEWIQCDDTNDDISKSERKQTVEWASVASNIKNARDSLDDFIEFQDISDKIVKCVDDICNEFITRADRLKKGVNNVVRDLKDKTTPISKKVIYGIESPIAIPTIKSTEYMYRSITNILRKISKYMDSDRRYYVNLVQGLNYQIKLYYRGRSLTQGEVDFSNRPRPSKEPPFK